MAYLFLSLILALLTAAFALQNTEAVTVRLLLWEYQTSLVLVILGSTISGRPVVVPRLPWTPMETEPYHTIPGIDGRIARHADPRIGSEAHSFP